MLKAVVTHLDGDVDVFRGHWIAVRDLEEPLEDSEPKLSPAGAEQTDLLVSPSLELAGQRRTRLDKPARTTVDDPTAELGNARLAAGHPTLRRRRLGHELRELREQAGLTLDQTAALLEDMSAAKISRIETARVSVRPRDVEALLTAYGLTDERRRANLITLAREARERGWWQRFGDAMSASRDVAIDLDIEADSIRIYSPQVVSSPFQTGPYARAVLKAIWASEPSEHLELRLARRMAHQEILQHRDYRISSVIEDCVLRRPVGSDAILREQLRRLAEFAKFPNVSVRILPLSVGAHAGHDGAFRIIDLWPPGTSVVHLEYPAGATYMEDPVEVDLYSDIFERLEDVAMTSEQSLELITKLSREKGM